MKSEKKADEITTNNTQLKQMKEKFRRKEVFWGPNDVSIFLKWGMEIESSSAAGIVNSSALCGTPQGKMGNAVQESSPQESPVLGLESTWSLSNRHSAELPALTITPTLPKHEAGTTEPQAANKFQ